MNVAKGEPVTAWQVLMPWVALLLAAVIVWAAAFGIMCLVGAVKGDPWRCWAGHDFVCTGEWDAVWSCSRCEKPAPKCRNCGGQHDPNAIVMCIVSTGSWR